MTTKFLAAAQGPFPSSSELTPEWKSFFTLVKKHLTKTLAGVAENVELSRGHFYFSGFLTRKSDGQIFYISCEDVRYYQGFNKLLVRTAKSYKDYTGGTNGYVIVDDNFEEKLLRFLGV